MDKRIPDAEVRRVWCDQKLTSAAAAASIGLSRTQLWVRAKKLNLPARPSGRREVIPCAVLAPLWAADVCVKDIAALYGCPENSVLQSARRYRLPRRTKGRHRLVDLASYQQELLGRIMQKRTQDEASRQRILARSNAAEAAL